MQRTEFVIEGFVDPRPPRERFKHHLDFPLPTSISVVDSNANISKMIYISLLSFSVFGFCVEVYFQQDGGK